MTSVCLLLFGACACCTDVIMVDEQCVSTVQHCKSRVMSDKRNNTNTLSDALLVEKSYRFWSDRVQYAADIVDCIVVPQAGIEPTFSRPQRDALTTGLSGPRASETYLQHILSNILH